MVLSQVDTNLHHNKKNKRTILCNKMFLLREIFSKNFFVFFFVFCSRSCRENTKGGLAIRYAGTSHRLLSILSTPARRTQQE
jgi:hypothetical protein